MPAPIETRRLTLVPKAPEQVRAEIAAMPAHEKAQLSAEWLARVERTHTIDPWVLGFTLVAQGINLPVGACGFKGPPDADGVVEIAYGIAPEHRNNGYASEAAAALLRFAFDSGWVRLVRAHTLADANTSARVLMRCGFSPAGQVIDPDDGLVWRWETKQSEKP